MAQTSVAHHFNSSHLNHIASNSFCTTTLKKPILYSEDEISKHFTVEFRNSKWSLMSKHLGTSSSSYYDHVMFSQYNLSQRNVCVAIESKSSLCKKINKKPDAYINAFHIVVNLRDECVIVTQSFIHCCMFGPATRAAARSSSNTNTFKTITNC